MNPEDIPKTAINTPFGTYTFNYSSSGLRHRITPEGVYPLPEKVAAVQDYPAPSTIKVLQEFWVMVNYYHQFLPAITATLGPLYVSLKDHMPLVHAFTRQSDAWYAHEPRYLSAVADNNCTLHYLSGKINPVADALSRNTLAAVQLGLDINALAEARRPNPEYQSCKISCTSLRWEDFPFEDSNTTLLHKVSTGRPRP
ncbi:uncharacterized protein [Palaemon carinicauda]|uniref:uncharacterized protein n=1 Tax=Palaemon carinicauda TaxID=392227 RepID=UPI0035B60BC2